MSKDCPVIVAIPSPGGAGSGAAGAEALTGAGVPAVFVGVAAPRGAGAFFKYLATRVRFAPSC